jgi:putative salt-induced outer membrane protein YdiY
MLRALTLTLLLHLPLLAADHVVLSNGDTVTGTIVKKDGDKLTIKSDLMGEVTMPWSAVKTITSDSEVFVQMSSGEIVKGKIATSGDRLQVATGTETKSEAIAKVAAVRDAGEERNFERLRSPRLLDLWAGNLDLGFALARGNARTDTFTTAFAAARITRTDKLLINFNQIYGTARVNDLTSTIASAVRGGWKYNRNVASRTFVTAMNDYEHDRFQNLNLRVVGGLGAGYNAIKRENLNLDVDAGVDYERENFIDGLHRNSAEANFGDALIYKVGKASSLTQAFRMFNNLSETGSYRVNFDLTGATVVRSWLSWQLTGSDRFLSNPVFGRQRNDIIISTGFRVAFKR